MKKYISRLKNGCKLPVFLYWSFLRLAMLYAFVATLFVDSVPDGEVSVLTAEIHILVCFFASFLWELSQAMPEKSLFRRIPSSVHTALNTGLALSSFFGVFLNDYYDMRYFDPIMQLLFGAWAVLYGYEIACAMVKRDKFSATKAMIFYAAFGVSFILFTACELGEFASDQLLGKIMGEPGNAQFWSMLLAEGSSRAETVIPPIESIRAPLMDIMNDIIMHTVGSFAALIFINVFPYRLRGKYRYDDMEFGNNNVRTKETANS